MWYRQFWFDRSERVLSVYSLSKKITTKQTNKKDPEHFHMESDMFRISDGLLGGWKLSTERGLSVLDFF